MALFAISNLCTVILLSLGQVLGHGDHMNPEEDGKLIFVSILYRHGERNPSLFYATDPYYNISYWPDGFGMLTKKGKQQQYQLGKWLRKRYLELIPNGRYSYQLAYVQSTDVDRTLMSAQANLAGFFYPTKEELWSNIDWQPVPVHTMPSSIDNILSMRFLCPKADQELETLLRTPALKEFNKKNKDVYDYLTRHTGQIMDDPVKVEGYRMALGMEQLYNYTLPEWTKKVYPEKIEEISLFAYRMYLGTEVIKRLKGGPLLSDIITHMKQKRDNLLHPNRSFWIYSGHDRTIVHLLGVMDVYESHIPPFAATVMVELRKNLENQFFVSVHYKNTTDGPPTLLTIPGCTPSCPLDTFESLLKKYLPLTPGDECQIKGIKNPHQIAEL